MMYDVDSGAGIQEKTMLGTNYIKPDSQRVARLYEQYWPPVTPVTGLSDALKEHMARSPEQRQAALRALASDKNAYGQFLLDCLGEIYSYHFSYRDGVATKKTDDALEIGLLVMKIELEREFIDNWFGPMSVPSFKDQMELADWLDDLTVSNPGVAHPLFEYIRTEASREQLQMFLRGEVVRTEVVDDEVAHLSVGLQGAQKAVIVANLWDECGRGKLENFHTFWMRRLIDVAPGGWDEFHRLRPLNPWFAKITSNTFNTLITRPAYKQVAFGCFTIFESWVPPHFQAILDGLARFGITDQDTCINFTAHVAVDVRHAHELTDGLRSQRPRLSASDIHDIARGALIGVTAGRRQYEYWLEFLTKSGGFGGKPA